MSDFIKVKNKEGTTNRPLSGYSSWIEFWEAKKDMNHCGCSNKNCDEVDDIKGAHVFIVGATSEEYIVPLCSACNHVTNTSEFEVVKSFLVRVGE
jgi:hypothetical protein